MAGQPITIKLSATAAHELASKLHEGGAESGVRNSEHYPVLENPDATVSVQISTETVDTLARKLTHGLFLAAAAVRSEEPEPPTQE